MASMWTAGSDMDYYQSLGMYDSPRRTPRPKVVKVICDCKRELASVGLPGSTLTLPCPCGKTHTLTVPRE